MRRLRGADQTTRARRLLVLLVLAGVWAAAAIAHRRELQPMTAAPRRTQASTPVDLRSVAADARLASRRSSQRSNPGRRRQPQQRGRCRRPSREGRRRRRRRLEASPCSPPATSCRTTRWRSGRGRLALAAASAMSSGRCSPPSARSCPLLTSPSATWRHRCHQAAAACPAIPASMPLRSWHRPSAPPAMTPLGREQPLHGPGSRGGGRDAARAGRGWPACRHGPKSARPGPPSCPCAGCAWPC